MFDKCQIETYADYWILDKMSVKLAQEYYALPTEVLSMLIAEFTFSKSNNENETDTNIIYDLLSVVEQWLKIDLSNEPITPEMLVNESLGFLYFSRLKKRS